MAVYKPLKQGLHILSTQCTRTSRLSAQRASWDAELLCVQVDTSWNQPGNGQVDATKDAPLSLRFDPSLLAFRSPLDQLHDSLHGRGASPLHARDWTSRSSPRISRVLVHGPVRVCENGEDKSYVRILHGARSAALSDVGSYFANYINYFRGAGLRVEQNTVVRIN